MGFSRWATASLLNMLIYTLLPPLFIWKTLNQSISRLTGPLNGTHSLSLLSPLNTSSLSLLPLHASAFPCPSSPLASPSLDLSSPSLQASWASARYMVYQEIWMAGQFTRCIRHHQLPESAFGAVPDQRRAIWNHYHIRKCCF